MPRDAIKTSLTFLAVIALVGCGAHWQHGRLVDGTKARRISLVKQGGQGHIYSLAIRGKGRIDGRATIRLLLNGKSVKVENLSGVVDFEWRNDWYNDVAVISYEPISVKAGGLRLRYQFHDL